MTNTSFIDPRPELIAAASHFYQQGWMVGTAGNLSCRIPNGSFWITASGRSKGELQLGDFIRMHLDGRVERNLQRKLPFTKVFIIYSPMRSLAIMFILWKQI